MSSEADVPLPQLTISISARTARRVGPFHGAGRQRSPALSEAARERREKAAVLAEALVSGGLDEDRVYLALRDQVDTVLALDGSNLRASLGRPRRVWSGYADFAHSVKVKIGREYALFAQENRIERVIQVVVRPPNSRFDLKRLAEWHGRSSAALNELLRYAKKSRAPSFVWHLVSAEFKNVGARGWELDGHFHLVACGSDNAELERIQAYFERRGWSFWFVPLEGEKASCNPVALAQYMAKGLAHALEEIDAWCPEALAELRLQTHSIALIRATGAFRKWRAAVTQAGVSVTEDEKGRPVLVRRAPTASIRRQLHKSITAVALRLCVHDFGDGLLRRAIRVRGNSGVTLEQLATAYDLDGVLTPFKESTAIPNS